MPTQFGYDLLSDIQGVQFRFATTAKDQESWRVQRVSLKESISGLYSLQVDLSSELPGPDAAAMLGEDVSLEITRNQDTRCIHGLVDVVTDGQWSSSGVFVRLNVRPALHALKQQTRSRIFPDMTVPAIVQSVLDEALEPYGRRLEPSNLSRSDYPRREYVVQLRESDFDFAARLLAEEGIWFYFRHPSDGKVEQLFLCDANESAPAAADDPKVEFSPDRDANAQHAAITVFSKSERQRATQLRVRQYNWTHPELEIAGDASVNEPAQFESQRPLTRYEHGDVTLYDYKEPAYAKHDASAQALVRFQHQRRDRCLIHGKSNVLSLRAGHFIQVDDQEFLILEVQHSGSATLSSGQAAHHGVYENTFICVPRALAYRPAGPGKARIDGLHTATVVDRSGKRAAPSSTTDGEDIVTDVHGRVRVKFPWDETDADATGTNSCWLRCTQLWAGNGWGAQFIPRVGMEVVVQFVDGDPDRPVVTGCLYNGLNPPPYAQTPTQSGIKTASSVDPARYNELRFEDAKDNEQIFVRAQKDYEEEVLNDHKTTVHANQTQLVHKNQRETVNGSASLSVGGSRSKGVRGAESIKVEGSRTTTIVKKNTDLFEDAYEQTVTAAVTITHGDTRTTTIKHDDIESITDGNKATSVVSGSYEVRSSKALTLVQDGTHSLQLDGKAHLQTSGEFSVTNGKCLLESRGDELYMEAQSAVLIGCGQATLELRKDGTINLTGVKVGITAGNNSIVADQTGVAVSGVKVSSTAVGVHEIQGALIKIG